MEIWPVLLTGIRTRLLMVWPVTQLRLDVAGRVCPPGYTIKTPPAAVFVTAILATTADTPAAGTPPTPVTWTVSVPPAASGDPEHAVPLPARVSQMRADGCSELTRPAVVVQACGT